MFDDFGINAGFVEDLHAQYRQSPQLVEEHWRSYFASLERGESPPSSLTNVPQTNGAAAARAGRAAETGGNGALPYALAKPAVAPPPVPYVNGVAPLITTGREERLAAAALSGRVYQLVNAYRVRGHLFAKIDPLGTPAE